MSESILLREGVATVGFERRETGKAMDGGVASRKHQSAWARYVDHLDGRRHLKRFDVPVNADVRSGRESRGVTVRGLV